MKKAVVLVSGGLDSATCVAIAKQQGFECYAVSFDYGQRHHAEINAAKELAASQCEQHRIVTLNINDFGGSALTDHTLDIPKYAKRDEIPITYVPARNTVFFSIALGLAEVLGAYDIFCGICAIDYSNYPDCRPEYIASFQHMANLATKTGVAGQSIQFHAPLLYLTKAEIILLGTQLGVNYAKTVSCYQATDAGLACGYCDCCVIRANGFKQAGLTDPTRYI